jgi:membrane protein implicated in regulation of membrane protease activity
MATVLGMDLSLLLLLVGALLVIGEAFAPGAHFIVLGVALLVAGLVGLALPETLGVFGVVILAGLVIGVGAAALYIYRQFDFYGGKGAGRTSDSDSLKGNTGHVTERVTSTGGEVVAGDRVTVGAEPDATLIVYWNEDDDTSAIIDNWEGPEA